MIIELTKAVLEKLSKTEQEVIRFINENERQLSELSIVEIAHETYSSPATVSRAIRKCNVNGFNELRYRLTLQDKSNEIQNIGEIMNKSLIEAQRVIEQISLTTVINLINDLKEASRIYVLARGLTEYVAQEFTFKLQLLNFEAFFITDPNIMQIKTKSMKKSELLLIFSLNGHTLELLHSAENANLCGAKVASCCCNKNSPLIELSDHYIIGYKHHHQAISTYEVASRIPLYMISRMIFDYINLEKNL